MKKKSKDYLHNRVLLNKVNELLSKKKYDDLQVCLGDLIKYFMLKYYGYFDSFNSAVDTCVNDFMMKYVLTGRLNEVRTSLIFCFIKQYVPGGYYYKELVNEYRGMNDEMTQMNDVQNPGIDENEMIARLDFSKVYSVLKRLIEVHVKDKAIADLLLCRFFVSGLRFKYVRAFQYLDVLYSHVSQRLREELKL